MKGLKTFNAPSGCTINSFERIEKKTFSTFVPFSLLIFPLWGPLLYFPGYLLLLFKSHLKAIIHSLTFEILKKTYHMKKIDDLFFFPLVCTIKKGTVNVGSLSVKNYQVLKVMPYGISCKLTLKLVPRHTYQMESNIFLKSPSKKCRPCPYIQILSRFNLILSWFYPKFIQNF